MPEGLSFAEEEGRVSIEGPGLRLTFRRSGDRWEHAFAVGDGSEREPRVIASSLEGDSSRDAPARVVSPVYQEVHRHSGDEVVVLLLTGQSSPHHFSAVVSARTDDAGIVVAVDLADRCRASVDVLGATYLVRLSSSDLLEAGQRRIVWGGDELGQGRLEFASDSLALAEAGRRATRVQALARIVPSTHTQRLDYRWRWTPAKDRS